MQQRLLDEEHRHHGLSAAPFFHQEFERILSPVHYWGTPVFPALLRELRPLPEDRILDIGSPRLPSLFLVGTCGFTLYATHLQDDSIFEWGELLEILGLGSDVERRYIVEKENARCLTYPDEYADRIYFFHREVLPFSELWFRFPCRSRFLGCGSNPCGHDFFFGARARRGRRDSGGMPHISEGIVRKPSNGTKPTAS